ncbi:MAG: CDP-alcohol phosphatidyltransferase family protein [Pseudomonadota bacterium]
MKGTMTRSAEAQQTGLDQRAALAPWIGFLMAAFVGAGAIMAASEWVLGLPFTSQSVLIATFLYLAAAGVTGFAIHTSYPHERLGWCNRVTLARLVVVTILAAALIEGTEPQMPLLVLAALSLCLDGVDGWLARREGLSSAFGARFDVEVDAAFALLLAVYGARTGVAAPYVILLGLPHYLFWIARSLLPWLNAPLPERFSRKAVCVLQIAVLMLLLVPQLAGSAFLNVAVAAVALALIWSFGRDIAFLYRSRT